MTKNLHHNVLLLATLLGSAVFLNFSNIPLAHKNKTTAVIALYASDVEALNCWSRTAGPLAASTGDLNISIISSTNLSCFLANDGAATALATGGSGNYTYLWSDGQTTASVTNLGAGFYGVTATDVADGNSVSTSITISQPQPLNLTVTVISEVNCFHPTGTALAVVSGGTADYQYLWENGETTPSATNLNPGMQTATVTDANGCIEIDQFTMPENIVEPVASAGDDVAQDCNHPGPQFTLDGSLSSEGPEYSYFWFTTNGNIVSDLTTQYPIVNELGTYTLMVTNNTNGCSSTDEVEVYENFETPLAFAGPSVAICEGDCHTLTATAMGGSIPYTYSWAGGLGASPSIEVCPTETTNYTVTVTGSNGCSSAGQVTVFVNANPSLEVHSIDCSPDVLTYSVSVISDGDEITASLGNIANLGNGFYAIDNIPADSASVTITAVVDNTSCFAELIIESPQCGCPDILSPEVSGNTVICEGMPLQPLFAEAPEGMVVDWFDEAVGGNLLLGESTEFLPSAPGTYYAQSREPSTDCTSEERTPITVMIQQTPEVIILQDGNFCEDDCTLLTVMGGQFSSYDWTTGQTTQSIFICSAGTYSVTATDFNGCHGEASIDIVPLETPTADAGIDFVLNCLDQEITIGGENSTTGTNIDYIWSNGATTPTQTINTPGEYFLTVVNNTTFCFDVDLVVITQEADFPEANAGEDTCIPCDTGAALLSTSVANDNETLQWSFMDQIISNNPTVFVSDTGLYILQVTNIPTGCSDTDTVRVDICSYPEIAIASFSDVLCNGENTGAVSFSVSGGTAPYTFEGLVLENNDLPAGSYHFSATDASGCTVDTIIVVSEPAPISIATSVTAESGIGLNDGSASAVALGGTPGYNFLWSNGANTPSISNLAPGNYFLTVTDANGCTKETSVTVEGFDCIEMNVSISGTGIICPGSNAGSLQVTVDNGGTGPFTFLWSTGSQDQQILELGAGIYSCTVTDNNNCETAAEFQITEEDNQPPSLITQNITLYLDEYGQASFMPWEIDGGSTDNCGLDSIWVSATQFHCGNIGQQVVQVMVFDKQQLSDMGPALVTIVDTLPPYFSSCPQNMVVSGCTDVEYSLPVALDNCSAPVAELTSGLLPGANFPEGNTEVVFTATDPSGNSQTCMFTVNVQPELSAEIDLSEVDCENGTITAVIIPEGGNPPYAFLWNTGAVTDHLTFIGSATVSWMVTDQSGCTVGQELMVDIPPAMGIEIISTPDQDMQANGTADATVSGGVPPYSYIWTIDGAVVASTEDVENLSSGTYCLLVTDASGCQVSSCVTIDLVTSSRNISFKELIRVTPNPADDLLTIDFQLVENNRAEIVFFNDKGQQISRHRKDYAQSKIELGTDLFPDGLYFIKIIIDGQIVVKKVIIGR